MKLFKSLIMTSIAILVAAPAFANIPAQLNCKAEGGRVVLAHIEGQLRGVFLVEGTGRRSLQDLQIDYDGRGQDLRNIVSFSYSVYFFAGEKAEGAVRNARRDCTYHPASHSE